MPTVDSGTRQELERIINDYPDRIPLQKVQRSVWYTLLSLGICPGGISYWALNYRNNQSETIRWWRCFNWTEEGPQPLTPADPAVENHINSMQSNLMSELMYALFPHVARTLEGLGQGWVTYKPYGNPSPIVVQATDAVIRELGKRRLHRYAEYFHPGSSKVFLSM